MAPFEQQQQQLQQEENAMMCNDDEEEEIAFVESSSSASAVVESCASSSAMKVPYEVCCFRGGNHKQEQERQRNHDVSVPVSVRVPLPLVCDNAKRSFLSATESAEFLPPLQHLRRTDLRKRTRCSSSTGSSNSNSSTNGNSSSNNSHSRNNNKYRLRSRKYQSSRYCEPEEEDGPVEQPLKPMPIVSYNLPDSFGKLKLPSSPCSRWDSMPPAITLTNSTRKTYHHRGQLAGIGASASNHTSTRRNKLSPLMTSFHQRRKSTSSAAALDATATMSHLPSLASFKSASTEFFNIPRGPGGEGPAPAPHPLSPEQSQPTPKRQSPERRMSSSPVRMPVRRNSLDLLLPPRKPTRAVAGASASITNSHHSSKSSHSSSSGASSTTTARSSTISILDEALSVCDLCSDEFKHEANKNINSDDSSMDDIESDHDDDASTIATTASLLPSVPLF